jgi:hypothetical protein
VAFELARLYEDNLMVTCRLLVGMHSERGCVELLDGNMSFAMSNRTKECQVDDLILGLLQERSAVRLWPLSSPTLDQSALQVSTPHLMPE